MFGVVPVPLGYRSVHLWVIILAFGTGIIDLIGVFFYYLALKEIATVATGENPPMMASVPMPRPSCDQPDARSAG